MWKCVTLMNFNPVAKCSIQEHICCPRSLRSPFTCLWKQPELLPPMFSATLFNRKHHANMSYSDYHFSTPCLPGRGINIIQSLTYLLSQLCEMGYATWQDKILAVAHEHQCGYYTKQLSLSYHAHKDKTNASIESWKTYSKHSSSSSHA